MGLGPVRCWTGCGRRLGRSLQAEEARWPCARRPRRGRRGGPSGAEAGRGEAGPGERRQGVAVTGLHAKEGAGPRRQIERRQGEVHARQGHGLQVGALVSLEKKTQQ